MKRARIIAVLVVVGAALGSAAVTPGDHMAVTPVMAVTPGGGTQVFIADNDGANTLNVFGIGRDPSCVTDDPVPQITAQFRDHMAPFTFAPADTNKIIDVDCPSTGPAGAGGGIRRCKFDVVLQGGEAGPGDTITSFTEICTYPDDPSNPSGITATPPNTWDVGNVMVVGGGMKTFGIQPSNLSTYYFSIYEPDGSVFSLVSPCTGVHCGVTLATPNPVLDVEVSCVPGTIGNKTAQLYIVSGTGESLPPITLLCNGTDTAPIGPNLNIPSTLDATSPRNMPTPGQLTLLNDGDSPLEVMNLLPAGPGTDWTFTGMSFPCNNLPCTIPAGDMVVVSFSFTPSVVGPVTTTNFTLSSNDPDAATFNIAATGTGTGSTLTLVAPTDATVDIGAAAIGGQVSRGFTFENAPSTDGIMTNASIESPSASGWFSVTPTFANMSVDMQQDFTVECTPLAAGTQTARLVVSSSATEGNTYSIPITCTGTTGSLTVSPSAIDLGDIMPGTTPITRTITLTTNGPTLPVGAITESPDVSQVTLGAPSGSDVTTATPVTFVLTYVPGNADGVVMTTIDVSAGGDTRQVTFRANVVRPPMCITPGGIAQGPIDFGPIAIKQSSATEEIVLQNCGTTMLALQSPTIEPAGEFALVGDALPMVLAPGEMARAMVTFAPQMVGVRMAQLIVPTSNGDLAVDLMGTGLGAGTTLGAPASLYACDCASSDPPNVLVILLALVIPLVPRRRRRC